MCSHLQRRGKRVITKALGTSERKTAAALCRRLGLELDHEPKRKPRRSRRGQARQPFYGAEGSP